jgi:hypothetical protein
MNKKCRLCVFDGELSAGKNKVALLLVCVVIKCDLCTKSEKAFL